MTGNQTVVAGLLACDVVLSDSGFFISVDGPLDLAGCEGYSINEAGCIVLQQEYGEAVLHPVPDAFRDLVEAPASIMFVRFDDGDLADAKDVSRKEKNDGHC